jgi:hypothetical protein
MTRNLNRLAEWSVMDGLVTEVYRESAMLSPAEPVRDLMREAALSLTASTSLEVAHAKLATLGYLFRSANETGLVPAEVVARMLERILESARALRRFNPSGSEPAPAPR